MSRARWSLMLRVGTPIVVVVIWLIVSSFSTNFYMPPLIDSVESFITNWLPVNQLVTQVLPSVVRVLVGFALATVLGTTIGLIVGLSYRVRLALNPILEFIRAIPAPALIPLAIVFFGVGNEMKVFIIALVCLFPILLNTVDGVGSIDPPMRETAQVYRITRSRYLFHVVIPSATPQIFAGMRTSLALSLVMMVVTEMIGGNGGIGFSVLLAARSFEITYMWSGIILLGILGVVFSSCFVLVEHRVLRWHRGLRGQQS